MRINDGWSAPQKEHQHADPVSAWSWQFALQFLTNHNHLKKQTSFTYNPNSSRVTKILTWQLTEKQEDRKKKGIFGMCPQSAWKGQWNIWRFVCRSDKRKISWRAGVKTLSFVHPACVLTCYWASIFHFAASGCLRVEWLLSTAWSPKPSSRTTLRALAMGNRILTTQTGASARNMPRKNSDHCHTWSCNRCVLQSGISG